MEIFQDRESNTDARKLLWYRFPASALMKEGQAYYSNNILKVSADSQI